MAGKRCPPVPVLQQAFSRGPAGSFFAARFSAQGLMHAV
jgi:hypothetical protein